MSDSKKAVRNRFECEYPNTDAESIPSWDQVESALQEQKLFSSGGGQANIRLEDVFPAGHRILVCPDPLEKFTAGGIALPETDKKRKQDAQHSGVVVRLGFNAWNGFDDGTPWALPGDRIYFAAYAGYVIEIDGVRYRCMNDEDVTIVIRKPVQEG